MTDPQTDLAALIASLPAQGVALEAKSSKWYWRALNMLVLIVTFGQNKTFMSNFVTTIGKTIGTPDTWDDWDTLTKLQVLRHELVHVAQYRKWGPLMSISWLLFPLPIGLAWFRYRWEREAYVESIRVVLQYEPEVDPAWFIEDYVDHFATADYGWAWPFRSRVRAWFKAQSYT